MENENGFGQFFNPGNFRFGQPLQAPQPLGAGDNSANPLVMAAMNNMLQYMGAGMPYMMQMTHALANGTPFSASHFSFGGSPQAGQSASKRFASMTNRRNDAQAHRQARAVGRQSQRVVQAAGDPMSQLQQSPGPDPYSGVA